MIPSFTPTFIVPHKGADDHTVMTIQVATVMVAITINAAIAYLHNSVGFRRITIWQRFRVSEKWPPGWFCGRAARLYFLLRLAMPSLLA